MTKRFESDGWKITDNKTNEDIGMIKASKLLNHLHEENQKQKTTIRMLEQQSQRQINRNERLHKDWDRLWQHLIDSGLMTDEEILKVI